MSDDTSEGRKALAAVQAAWNSAGKDWNPEALTAVYTADALFFGGRPGHSVGANPIREYFASYVGVIESGSMELVDQQIARLAAECFLAQGYGEFSFLLAGNQSTRSRLRTTFVIVMQEGRWKIRQHHVSASPSAPPLNES